MAALVLATRKFIKIVKESELVDHLKRGTTHAFRCRGYGVGTVSENASVRMCVHCHLLLIECVLEVGWLIIRALLRLPSMSLLGVVDETVGSLLVPDNLVLDLLVGQWCNPPSAINFAFFGFPLLPRY